MTYRDNRFGRFKFGTSHKFGASDLRESLAWDISIDWNDDGIYDVNESSRLIGINVRRGRTKMLKPKGEGIEKIANGTATITLSNYDGRYDAWNTASPLYPNVDEGKYIRVRVRDMNSTALPYAIITGEITSIVPTGRKDKAKVVLYVSDGLIHLRNNPASVDMKTDITPAEAIGYALDSAKYPTHYGRNIEASADNIDYFWCSGSRAIDEINDIADSFFGYFFVDASGRATFLNRSNVTDLVAEYPQEYLLKDIGNPQPYEVKRNVVRLTVHPRKQAALGTIFETVGSLPYIDAGQTFRFFPEYSYNGKPVPALNVDFEEYEANAQSDLLGTDKTANCIFTITDFGQKAMVTVVNNDASRVYIYFKIQGEAIYEPNAADVTYPSNPATVARSKELKIDLKWQQNANVAGDIAGVLGLFFSEGRPTPVIKIENRPDIQFAPDLFSIVSADIPKLGINGVSFRVGGIEHSSQSTGQNDNCQKIITTLWLEPYISAGDFMTWDTASEWDTETVFGW